MSVNKKNIDRKSWIEFKESGLLWFINKTLHLFGWSIVLERDNNTGEIVDAYPARVTFRGFTEESNTNGYKRVTEYLQENINDISKDIE